MNTDRDHFFNRLRVEEFHKESYKKLKERKNVAIFKKEDQDIYFVEISLKKAAMKAFYDLVLKQEDWENVCPNQIFSGKKLGNLNESEIFSTVYKGKFPYSNREAITKRFIDNEKEDKIIAYTSYGTEHVNIFLISRFPSLTRRTCVHLSS
jgi:hypothetical protein